MHKNNPTHSGATGIPQPAGKRVKTDAAARYLGISASKLNKLRVYSGGPRYFKIGRTVVYDLADLDAWLASFSQTSTSQNVAA